MCLLYVGGEGRSGVALLILLIVLNFMKIAEVFLLRCRRVMYRQHDMVIGRNNRPVERSVVAA